MMLVRVALDPDMFFEKGNGAAQHRSLIFNLIKHGIVVEHTKGDTAKLLTDPRLPQSVKLEWREAHRRILYAEPRGSPDSLALIRDVNRLYTQWRAEVSLLIVRDTFASGLQVPPGDSCFISGGLEVVRFGDTCGARTFLACQKLADGSLKKGDTREKVWTEWLQPLATHATRLTILDRYAGINLADDRDAGIESGLQWLLKRLDDTTSRGIYVHLILGVKTSRFARRMEDAARRVDNAVCNLAKELGRGIQDLKLTMVEDTNFHGDAHDRHLRFDSKAIEIGYGVGILGQEEMTQYYSIKYISNDETPYRREREVLDISPERIRLLDGVISLGLRDVDR